MFKLATHRVVRILLVMCVLYAQRGWAAIHYPDFDRSMLRLGMGLEVRDPDFEQKSLDQYYARNQCLFSLFRTMYYRNIQEAAQSPTIIRIPRIIHQIWLGSPVPEEFSKWMSSWAMLKGWEYKLWTDKEVQQLRLHNQSLYDSPIPWVQKSDILRLELLQQFGGVYADVDLECLNPEMFEELHHSFDFYIAFEPQGHGYTRKFNVSKLCNAIIASAPGHPLIHDLVVNLRANYFAYKPLGSTIHLTGPSYLTRIICEHELAGAHKKRNMYLPSTFFYPLTEAEIIYWYQHPEAIKLLPETAGIHYWYGSWWKKIFDHPYISDNDVALSDQIMFSNQTFD